MLILSRMPHQFTTGVVTGLIGTRKFQQPEKTDSKRHPGEGPVQQFSLAQISINVTVTSVYPAGKIPELSQRQLRGTITALERRREKGLTLTCIAGLGGSRPSEEEEFVFCISCLVCSPAIHLKSEVLNRQTSSTVSPDYL